MTSLWRKHIQHQDERLSGAVLRYYDGDGAVRLVSEEGDLQIQERLGRPLLDLVLSGRDEEATLLAVDVVMRLHRPRPNPPALPSLKDRFAHGTGNAIVEELLRTQGTPIVLHGDIHHENILEDDRGNWRAIDPKGLWGERSYDFANLLCNPVALPEVALNPERLSRQIKRVSLRAGLDCSRLSQWVFAHACLALAWSREDQDRPEYWEAMVAVAQQVMAKTSTAEP